MGDERSNYASWPWKVILMVGGAAVGLVALVGAIIVVLKKVRKPGSSSSFNKAEIKLVWNMIDFIGHFGGTGVSQ